MSDWKSIKAKRLLAALLKIGWHVNDRQAHTKSWNA
jgi:predicted RNA binding protein YcfA (HicA-like mRNA interferase family)